MAAAAATAALIKLAAPVLGLRLCQASNASLALTGGSAAAAIITLENSGIGSGLSTPINILTTDLPFVRTAVEDVPGVAAVIAPLA